MLKSYVSCSTDVSLYFLRIERSCWFGAGIIALAYFTLKQPLNFQIKVFLFFVYSIGLFCLYPIITLYSKKYPRVLKEIDQERIKSIEQSDLPSEQKVMLLQAYLPTPPILQGIAIIMLFWWLLFELFLVCDLAIFLSQFMWVKQVVDLLTSGIFFSYSPSVDQNIFLLQIFKASTLISLPFKVISIFILVYPFLRNPKIFPFTTSAIFANKKRSVIGGILWSLIGTLIFFVGAVAGFFEMFFGTYRLGDYYGAVSDLSPYFWYKANGFIIFFCGFSLTCLIKILTDWFRFIFLTKREFNT